VSKKKSPRAAKKTPSVRKKSLFVPTPTHWTVRIARFNPEMDYHPRTHEYGISPHSGESVLDLLLRIKHTQDGSLTFRGSCGYGGCGTCGVKANGKTILSCVTQVEDVMDGHHHLRIDPLHDNVLKDLVVDEAQFFQQLLKVKPWMVPRTHDEKRAHKMGVNDVQKMGKSPQCILCGICDANAGSTRIGELGPSTFVKAYRYAHDLRDADNARLSTLRAYLPVHYSLSKANECPRDIRPGDLIQQMRQEAQKKSIHTDKNDKKDE
jgi:succinate dehydrogenase / fumarate reductase iron-sulfur subunit